MMGNEPGKIYKCDKCFEKHEGPCLRYQAVCNACSNHGHMAKDCPYVHIPRESDKTYIAKQAAGHIPASNVVCFTCKAIGHFAKDCPRIRSQSEATKKAPSKEGGAGSAGSSRVVCYRCNDVGHIAKDCSFVLVEPDRMQKLENQIKNLQMNEEKVKKLEETIAKIKPGESEKSTNESPNKSVEVNDSSPKTIAASSLGPIPTPNTANIGNPCNFPGPAPNFNGPLPRLPYNLVNFVPPQMPQNASMSAPNIPYIQTTNQMSPNQGQWDTNRNFNVPTFAPRPLMNSTIPPPPLNQNYPQQFCNQQQYMGQNQPQFNKPYQHNQNQNQNRSQEYNRGRGRGNFNNRTFRRGGPRRDQGGNNNNNTNYRNNRENSRGRNKNNNSARPLFSNEEPKVSKSDENEGNIVDKDKPGKHDSVDNRQKKDHQGVFKGGIQKDKQRTKGYRGDKKDCARNVPQKRNDSNGDSDSTSTGYETAPAAEQKNRRRGRKKNEASNKTNNTLGNIGPSENGGSTSQEDAEKPLSKNNLGKDDILLKYIGTNLPAIGEAVFDNISLYHKVEGVMLMSDPSSNEPMIESAKTLLHIIEFKSKYPNAKSFFSDLK